MRLVFLNGRLARQDTMWSAFDYGWGQNGEIIWHIPVDPKRDWIEVVEFSQSATRRTIGSAP